MHGLVGRAPSEIALPDAGLPPSSQALVGRRVTSNKRLVLHIVEAETLKTRVRLLLTKKTAEGPIPALTTVAALIVETAAVVLKCLLIGIVLRVVVALQLAYVDVSVVQLFSLDVELAQLVHIVYHVMAHFHAFSCLLQGVLVPVNLRQDGTILKFQLSDDEDLPHPVRDALFLQVD